MASAKTGAGQTALVTGASGGIGLDLAECFARDGYDLILTARSGARCSEVADRLAQQYGVNATPIALDLGAIGGGAAPRGADRAPRPPGRRARQQRGLRPRRRPSTAPTSTRSSA